MTKKVFISLPMKGKTDKEIGNRLCSLTSRVKEVCKKKFGWGEDVEIVLTDNFFDVRHPNHPADEKHKSCYYLGQAIIKLASADAIYFDEGWEHANGCLVERFVALKYDIPVLFWNCSYDEVVEGEVKG